MTEWRRKNWTYFEGDDQISFAVKKDGSFVGTDVYVIRVYQTDSFSLIIRLELEISTD